MRHGARKLKTNNLPDEFIPWLIKRKQSNSIIYRLTQEADGFNENSPMNEYWDPDKSYDGFHAQTSDRRSRSGSGNR